MSLLIFWNVVLSENLENTSNVLFKLWRLSDAFSIVRFKSIDLSRLNLAYL